MKKHNEIFTMQKRMFIYFTCCALAPIRLFFEARAIQSHFIYRTRAIISRSRFEAALIYKPRILSLKNEEFPFLVHKLSAI